MATELPINQLFLSTDEEKSHDQLISHKFIMQNLTRNIEYRLAMKSRIKMLKDDPNRPGLKIEEIKESHQSSWVKVFTSAKIFSGEFNFTQILFDEYLKNPRDERTREKTEKVQGTIRRAVETIDQNYLSAGDLKFVRSPLNRTMVHANLFFKLDSSAKVDDLNSRIRHVWPMGENFGLDFHSILIEDFNECGTKFDDCHRRAQCYNMEGMFACRCDEGYFDQSKSRLES